MSETSPPIRVMVVDDHPMWRDGVARDLAEAGYEVVAAIGEGAQAVRVAAAVRPDVVVLDLQLPDLSGVEVIRGLLRQQARTRVLVLSASGEHRDVLETVKAGAAGYLTKSAKKDELIDAVRRTAEGEAVFTAGLAGLVLGEFRRLATAPADVRAGRAAASPSGRPRSCAWSPRACRTSRSPSDSCSPTGPCRTTSRTRSTSFSCTTGSNSRATRSSAASTQPRDH